MSIFEVSYMLSPRLNGFVLGLSFAFGIFMYSCQKFIFEPVSYTLKQKYPEMTYLWLFIYLYIDLYNFIF